MVARAQARASLPDGGRFVALDSLRGIAALGVVAFHVRGGGPLFETSLARNGQLWVDFFFVLSGFVVAASYSARLVAGFAVRRFMLPRMGRVYPVHAVVLAAYVAMEGAQYVFSPQGWSLREPFAGYRSLPDLLLTVLLLQGFRLDASRIWNRQSWSISVEVWLYLAIALAWRALGARTWLLAFALGLAAALAVGLEASATTPFVSAYMLRGVAGFGVGVPCWQMWQGGKRAQRSARLAAGTELVAAALMLLVIAWPEPGSWRYAEADAVFAAAILVFAAQAGAVSRLLAKAPFVFLGTVSYSLYMVHPLVIGRGVDLYRAFGWGALVFEDGQPVRRIVAPPLVADALGVALMAAAVGAAWVSWRYLEWPARNWSRARAARLGAGREEAIAPTI